MKPPTSRMDKFQQMRERVQARKDKVTAKRRATKAKELERILCAKEKALAYSVRNDRERDETFVTEFPNFMHELANCYRILPSSRMTTDFKRSMY